MIQYDKDQKGRYNKEKIAIGQINLHLFIIYLFFFFWVNFILSIETSNFDQFCLNVRFDRFTRILIQTIKFDQIIEDEWLKMTDHLIHWSIDSIFASFMRRLFVAKIQLWESLSDTKTPS